VLGAGSWGTALAVHLGRIGHDVRLWARDPALVDEMIVRRANATYLPDVPLRQRERSRTRSRTPCAMPSRRLGDSVARLPRRDARTRRRRSAAGA
jgi:glycerol-3-phosphate dehydrogenase